MGDLYIFELIATCIHILEVKILSISLFSKKEIKGVLVCWKNNELPVS